MTNTVVRSFSTVETAEIVRNQIEEHIQEKVEKIHEKKAAARGRLRRAIDFLFSCNSDNPYQLSPSMKAKLYL